MKYATGNDVREVRNRIGFSQEKLAAEWGISKPTIQAWERQRDQPVARPKLVAALLRELQSRHPQAAPSGGNNRSVDAETGSATDAEK